MWSYSNCNVLTIFVHLFMEGALLHLQSYNSDHDKDCWLFYFSSKSYTIVFLNLMCLVLVNLSYVNIDVKKQLI